MQPDLRVVLTDRDLYDRVCARFPASCRGGQSVQFVLEGGVAPPETSAYLDARYDHIQSHVRSGWRTVWFNAEGRLAPQSMPVQDADLLTIGSLASLPSLLAKPTLAQCMAWWDGWDMPQNIRRHVMKVARAAYVLAVKMRNEGVSVDPILAHRGGLLHDLDKLQTLHEDGRHGAMGADFVAAQGYSNLADVIRGHIMYKILEPGADDQPWETKLVCFTDKLVEGAQLVPFNVRLEALVTRYPQYQAVLRQAEDRVWAWNDQICSILSIPNHEKLISTLIDLQ